MITWHRTGDETLSEPMMLSFTDAYMFYSLLLGYPSDFTKLTYVLWDFHSMN